MLDMVLPTIEYPGDAMNKAIAELKTYCEEMLGEIDTGARFALEAQIYGQLVQLFDKHNIKTQGVSITLKVGYYSTRIYIMNHLGQELGVLEVNRGQVT